MSSKEQNEAEESRRFQEQCFLMDNYDIFCGKGNARSYDNFCKGVGDNPLMFISKLTMPAGLKSLMDIKPAQLSGLVPYIRLFKVYYPTPSSEGEEYELNFEDHLSKSAISSMMTNRAGRGAGCGIKSFEWDLAGGNPAEADKLIEAKMVLMFQDVNDIAKFQNCKNPTNDKTKKFRFADLIHQEMKHNKGGGYNGKYFRVKAMVGWAMPPRWLGGEGDILTNSNLSAAQQTTLNQTGYTFYLQMVKHDLDFKDDGTLEITINYMAAVEGALSDKTSDILLMDKNQKLRDLEKERDDNKKAIDEANRAEKCKEISSDEAESRREAAEEANKGDDGIPILGWGSERGVEQEIRAEKAKMYRAFLSKLDQSGGIYRVDIPAEQLGEWENNWFSADEQESASDVAKKRTGPRASKEDRMAAWGESIEAAGSGNFGAVMEAADGMVGDDGEEADASKVRDELSGEQVSEPETSVSFSLSLNPVNVSEVCRINFIYFGAMLDTALDVVCSREESSMNEIRSLCGPISFNDPRTGQPVVVNMADIPVSLNMFNMWFFDNCIGPQRTEWRLKQFIQEVIEKLIGGALTPMCFGNDQHAAIGRPKLHMKVLQVPLTDDKKCRLTGKSTVKSFNKTKSLSLAKKPAEWPKGDNAQGLKSGSYFFMYATSSSARSLGPSPDREGRDAKNGIYHFKLGSDRGLVKKIKFKKVDQPHLGAARIVANGPGVLGLREPYNADIDMFGNALWSPGSLVFINADQGGPIPSEVRSELEVSGEPATAGVTPRYDSIAHALGLGGYYTVIKAKSHIEGGKFETKLETVFMAAGHGGKGDGAGGNKCADGTTPNNMQTLPSGSAGVSPPDIDALPT